MHSSTKYTLQPDFQVTENMLNPMGKQICKHDVSFWTLANILSFFKHIISDTESVSILRCKGSHSYGLEPWGHVFLGAQLRGKFLYLVIETLFLTIFLKKIQDDGQHWKSVIFTATYHCQKHLQTRKQDTFNGLHIFLEVTELPWHFSDSNLIFIKFTPNFSTKYCDRYTVKL
jgi:hypothetical protein